MRPLLVVFTIALLSNSAAASLKVVGKTQTDVPILKAQNSAKAEPGGQAFDFDTPAPSTTSPEAIALAKKIIQGFGGRAAISAWIDHGERRGHQTVLVPARIEATYVDRRAPGKMRLDIVAAGLVISMADAPSGGWQSYLGLVSDLPQAQRDENDRQRAHDEGLLLQAVAGKASAQVVRDGGREALAIWGPSGSATLFVPGTGHPLDEVRFREQSELRKAPVPQAILYSDWRTLEPERTGRSGPAGTYIPFSTVHEVSGIKSEADSLLAVDLLAVVDDSVFARPGASEHTLGQPQRAVLPLERRGEHHFAQVSINGGPPRLFLVDTGAGMTAVSRELADTLGLEMGEALDIVGLGGGVQARSVTLSSVDLGGIVRKDASALVLDFSEMRRKMNLDVEGILGFSVLNRYAVTFDFAHSALEIVQNGPRKVPGAGGARVPMEMLGGSATVAAKLDGAPAGSFILDTGSWITFVPTDAGRKLSAVKRVPGVSVVGADGHVLEAEAVRARSLAIGAARVDRPIVLFPTSGGESDPTGITLASGERGVLGSNVLRRFRMTLDYPRSELVLDPAPNAAKLEESSEQFGLIGPGIVLRAAERGMTVRHVVAGSPAARVGIKPGDRVLGIDGLDVEGEDVAEAQRRLSGPEHTSVRVRFEGRTLELERIPLL